MNHLGQKPRHINKPTRAQWRVLWMVNLESVQHVVEPNGRWSAVHTSGVDVTDEIEKLIDKGMVYWSGPGYYELSNKAKRYL